MLVIKNLFKAVAVITIFSVVTRIMGFLFRIYLANKIGSEALGIYQIGFSLFIVLATIVGSGLPLALSKLTAKYRTKGDLKSEGQAVSASLVMGLAVSLFICLALFLFKDKVALILASSKSIDILLMLAPAIIATALFSSFRGSLWGQKKHFAVSFTEFIEQIFRTIIAVVLIEFSIFNLSGAMSASLALSVGCFISAIMAAWYYFKSSGKLYKPTKQSYKTVLKSAAPITGVRVASSLIQPLIAVLIPLRLIAAGFTSSQALSQLGTVVGMTFPLLFLPITIVGALSTALIPELSELIATNKVKALKKQINTSLKFTLFVAFVVVPIYIGLGSHIGVFLFNNLSSGEYLSSAAWIMIPMSLAAISASILNTLNLEIKSFKNYLIGSTLLLLSVWFLPEYIGMRALTLGMGVCMTLITALNLRMIASTLKLKLSIIKPLVLMSIFIIPSSLLASWSFGSLSFLFPTFVALAIASLFAVIMFILLCLVFEIVNFDLWFLKLKDLKNVKAKKVKA